jgi:hypothetical protein
MKKRFIILFLVVAVAVAIHSCKKGDISGDPKGLVLGSYPTIQRLGNSSLNTLNLDSSTATIVVGENGAPIASINVWVVLGQNLNPSSWTLIRNVPFKDSAVISVTGADIAKALGVPSDSITSNPTIYLEDVTKDGRKFSIANTPTNYESFPAYNMAFIWPLTLMCPYDPAFFTGTFAIVSDQWNDFSPGDPISVTAGPGTNQLTLLLYPSPNFGSNRKAIVADVDPVTDSVKIPLQPIGDYTGDPGYTLQGVGFLATCTGTITLTVSFASPADGQIPGTFVVQMTKQ